MKINPRGLLLMVSEQSIVRVFVSSTSEDLKPFRAVARDVILKMGWVPIMMEDFGAIATSTVHACHDKLAECQLVLLIQAFRRGWVPTPEQGGNGTDSVTALEVRYARSQQRAIPVLAMLASETWPGNHWEKDDAGRKWVEGFRGDINLPAEFFDYEDPSGADDRRLPAFRAKVSKVLLAQRERMLHERVSGRRGLDFFDSACEAFVRGRFVPFVGTGIYGEGPLGVGAITRQLLGDGDTEPARCLVSGAEYRERFLGDRDRLLEQLRDVIASQSRQAQPPAVLNALLMKLPPLIIAPTYDQMLEQQLRAAGHKFAVVAHVVNSFNHENDGKVVIFRDRSGPVTSLADAVELASDEIIVYRPLGSPLLHDSLDPDLAIDTVVITEADHLSFLGRLENQHTRIPTAFSRPLQTRPLLFLGYGLDVWHYRLVMRVFQVVGVGPKHASIIAVRLPASPMEDLAWKRLGADVVRMDPNDFASRVLRALEPA